MKLYLCERSTKKNLVRYVTSIKKIDKKISIAYILSLIPKTRVVAKAALKLLKGLQQKENLMYFKKLYSNKYCTKLQKAQYLVSPFKMKFLLFNRHLNQTTKLRNKKWMRYTATLSPEKILLRTHFSYSNGSLTTKTTELSQMAFLP